MMYFIFDPGEKFLASPIIKWRVSEHDVGMEYHFMRYFEDITDDYVFNTFRNANPSSPGIDGWEPGEFRLLSKLT